MAETKGKGVGGIYSLRWIVLGVVLLAVGGGAYALLHDRLTALTDRLKQAESEARDGEFQVAIIPVEGMTCAACAARVKKTLLGIEGVAIAEVSLVERNVKVRYVDKTLTSENLVAAINALGYKTGAPIAAESKTESTNGSGAFRKASESHASSVTIPVTGMACEYCVKSLEDKLRTIDGVRSVQVSLSEKAVRVDYVKDKVAVERLMDEIDAKGFKAGSPVNEEQK